MRTQEQRSYEDAYEQRQRDYHTVQALRDCTEAVDHADDETIAKTLVDIGNAALLVRDTGDLDDKIAFVDFVCAGMDNLINKYANDQAYKDVNHRGFRDAKPW